MADLIPASAGRAKPNKVLKDFFEEVKVGFLEDTFTLRGHKWTMRTPTPDEEAWADRSIQSDTAASFVSSQRIARLSIAIKAIDGTPLESMYEYQDDMSSEDRKLLNEQPERKRYWLYAQLLTSLASDIPPPVIRELWEKYETLIKRQEKALSEAVEAGPNS
jgi:hypothetical protein